MGLLTLLTNGLPLPDVALLIPRLTVGVFFALSGGNKLFTYRGHTNLVASLKGCGIPCVSFMCWWVAFWEFFSGALLALGLFSAFNAAVLAIVCIVATCGTGPRKVNARSNFNWADRATNWIYLPELALLYLLAITMLAGPGAFSLDAVLFR